MIDFPLFVSVLVFFNHNVLFACNLGQRWKLLEFQTCFVFWADV